MNNVRVEYQKHALREYQKVNTKVVRLRRRRRNGEQWTGVSRGDLQDIFKKKRRRMMVVVTKTTFLDDEDDEKSEEEEDKEEEEEIIETEKQEDGEEEDDYEEEEKEDEEDKENVYEVSVRVLGTLESFDASDPVGVLKDDAFAHLRRVFNVADV